MEETVDINVLDEELVEEEENLKKQVLFTAGIIGGTYIGYKLIKRVTNRVSWELRKRRGESFEINGTTYKIDEDGQVYMWVPTEK